MDVMPVRSLTFKETVLMHAVRSNEKNVRFTYTIKGMNLFKQL